MSYNSAERLLVWCHCSEYIKVAFQEVGSVGMDWIDLAQDKDRWRTRVMRLGSVQCGEFLDWVRNGQLLRKDCTPCSLFVCYLVTSLPRFFNGRDVGYCVTFAWSDWRRARKVARYCD